MSKKSLHRQDAERMLSRMETLHTHICSAGTAREMYKATIELEQLHQDYDNLCQDKSISDTLYQIANRTTYTQLQILGRGRKYTRKDGTIVHTEPSLEAMQILREMRYNTDSIYYDLVSATYLQIMEHMTDGKIMLGTYELPEGRIIDAILPADNEDMTPIKEILGTPQKELYQRKQKHFKHLYIPQMDENGNEIDPHMYTLAERAHTLSVHGIESDDLLNSLSVVLTTDEKAVLNARLKTKQVERNYTSNGKQKKHFVTRKLSNNEVSDITGLSIQTVKTCLKNIQKKCQTFLD